MSSTKPDEYVGVVVNDEATEIPTNATVQVSLHCVSWQQFEENVDYLKSVHLPGLGETRRLTSVGVYRETEPDVGPRVLIIATVPPQDNNAANARHIEEVLNRVDLAA